MRYSVQWISIRRHNHNLALLLRSCIDMFLALIIISNVHWQAAAKTTAKTAATNCIVHHLHGCYLFLFSSLFFVLLKKKCARNSRDGNEFKNNTQAKHNSIVFAIHTYVQA